MFEHSGIFPIDPAELMPELPAACKDCPVQRELLKQITGMVVAKAGGLALSETMVDDKEKLDRMIGAIVPDDSESMVDMLKDEVASQVNNGIDKLDKQIESLAATMHANKASCDNVLKFRAKKDETVYTAIVCTAANAYTEGKAAAVAKRVAGAVEL